ncbi:hypothetical protein JCM13580A_10300 [Streptomyces drozdowiczii]
MGGAGHAVATRAESSYRRVPDPADMPETSTPWERVGPRAGREPYNRGGRTAQEPATRELSGCAR